MIEDAETTRLFPVHRLDRDTSGIVVFALTSQAAAAFSKILLGRDVQKSYLAVVRGETPEEGEIRKPLPKKGAGGTEPAWTIYRRVRTGKFKNEVASMIEARIITGRFHQIRRHFEIIGHPVLGDTEAATSALAPRLMLHAWRLEFKHPKNGKTIRIESKPPKEFKV